MYRCEKRSYRDLPIRFADFGRLHRAERSGTLHGLTRVRAMSQDDAHIFCTEEQIAGRDRPEPADGPRGLRRAGLRQHRTEAGDDAGKASWQRGRMAPARGGAGRCDERNGFSFELNPGEGAFYGPKIEIYVPDALKRKWQVATIQLDFNMPERFGLEYTTSAGTEARPVMIHRAVLGTLERFIGVLLEHTAGCCRFGWRPSRYACFRSAKKSRITRLRLPQLISSAGFRASADLRGEKARLQGARSGTGQNSLHGRGRGARGSLPDGRAPAPARRKKSEL